ncbi:hypothetical protein ACIGMX_34935 [Streptomyces aquilus]|uniref:hypothetical protein n=1 Tax=Streptomyces aquilus TaxID=2548456 RepID=UPI0037D352D4
MTETARREPPNHDTTTCFTKYRCRRPECVARYNANEQRRRKLRKTGAYDRFTDAEPIRVHVQQLVAAGAAPRAIAVRAQVAIRVVFDLLPLSSTGARKPLRHRLLTVNAEKLLAVTADDVVPQYVPALGTVRRLQALVADGWPMLVVAPFVGLSQSYVSALLHRDRACDDLRVRGTTALSVARGYDHLRGKRPTRHGASRRTVTIARGIGKSRGWTPTRYWDQFPGAIDDPYFISEYAKPRLQVVAEDGYWLMTTAALDRADAAERLGVDRSYLDRAFAAHPAAGAEAAA